MRIKNELDDRAERRKEELRTMYQQHDFSEDQGLHYSQSEHQSQSEIALVESRKN